VNVKQIQGAVWRKCFALCKSVADSVPNVVVEVLVSSNTNFDMLHAGMEGYHHIPVEDLILDHELRVAKRKNYDSYKCPCANYKGGIRKPIGTIRQHLRDVPQDRYLYHSMIGEDPTEGSPNMAYGFRMET
jgi:hypothetical protein